MVWTMGRVLILGSIFFFTLKFSQHEIQDNIYNVVDGQSFSRHLDNKINDHFIDMKNEGEVSDILSGMEEMAERVGFLEEQLTIQSYSEDENLDEAK